MKEVLPDDNRLIAEFMGIELFGKDKDFTEALLICSALDLNVNPLTHFEYIQEDVYLDDMRFDSSWDWLIPVVEKIMSICFTEDQIETDEDLSSWFYGIRDQIPEIHTTYSAVVEFIKWYNDN